MGNPPQLRVVTEKSCFFVIIATALRALQKNRFALRGANSPRTRNYGAITIQ